MMTAPSSMSHCLSSRNADWQCRARCPVLRAWPGNQSSHLILSCFSEVPVSAGEHLFSRLPICEHMAEPPKCPQTPKPICGTNGVTYKNECHLCVTRIKTRNDIQIMKDGKC
ncbi:serine protease inhibitor Kazal-type 4 [Sigmodon hispidus]